MEIVKFCHHKFVNFYDSPHRSYSLLRYPTNLDIYSRITLCTGQRFENGFLTYIGCKDEFDAETIIQFVKENGGYFRKNECFPRPSDRLFYRDRLFYPLELKTRRLPLDVAIEIAEHW